MTEPESAGKRIARLTDEELQAIRERCMKATPGPWHVKRVHASANRCDGIEAHIGHTHPPEQSCWDVDECPGQDAEMIVETDSGCYGPNADDAEFIANARMDVPRLLELAAELAADRQAVDELLKAAEAVQCGAEEDDYARTIALHDAAARLRKLRG